MNIINAIRNQQIDNLKLKSKPIFKSKFFAEGIKEKRIKLQKKVDKIFNQ